MNQRCCVVPDCPLRRQLLTRRNRANVKTILCFISTAELEAAKHVHASCVRRHQQRWTRRKAAALRKGMQPAPLVCPPAFTRESDTRACSAAMDDEFSPAENEDCVCWYCATRRHRRCSHRRPCRRRCRSRMQLSSPLLQPWSRYPWSSHRRSKSSAVVPNDDARLPSSTMQMRGRRRWPQPFHSTAAAAASLLLLLKRPSRRLLKRLCCSLDANTSGQQQHEWTSEPARRLLLLLLLLAHRRDAPKRRSPRIKSQPQPKPQPKSLNQRDR